MMSIPLSTRQRMACCILGGLVQSLETHLFFASLLKSPSAFGLGMTTAPSALGSCNAPPHSSLSRLLFSPMTILSFLGLGAA